MEANGRKENKRLPVMGVEEGKRGARGFRWQSALSLREGGKNQKNILTWSQVNERGRDQNRSLKANSLKCEGNGGGGKLRVI